MIDCSVQCTVYTVLQGHKTCLVVPGHALVPFVSATSCKVCDIKAYNASKLAHFTKDPFLRLPVNM